MIFFFQKNLKIYLFHYEQDSQLIVNILEETLGEIYNIYRDYVQK